MPPPKRPRPPQAELDAGDAMAEPATARPVSLRSRRRKDASSCAASTAPSTKTRCATCSASTSPSSRSCRKTTSPPASTTSARPWRSPRPICSAISRRRRRRSSPPFRVAPLMPFSDKRTGKQIVEKSSLFKQGLGKFHYLKGDALVHPRPVAGPLRHHCHGAGAAEGTLSRHDVGVRDRHAGQAADDGHACAGRCASAARRNSAPAATCRRTRRPCSRRSSR